MEKKIEQQNNWVFLPVHKQRIIKQLGKATLIKVDFDRSTILPLVFKRSKETEQHIYYSLPKDFNANIRVSQFNETTRRYEHKDYSVSIKELENCGLDKPLELDEDVEVAVGMNVEPSED